jgi:hypothetical protein
MQKCTSFSEKNRNDPKDCEDTVNYVAGFQRCRSITTEDVCDVLMSAPGRWFSLSEVVALLSDKIAPEEAARFFSYYRNGRNRSGQPSNLPLFEKIERGKRHLLRQKLTGMHTAGYIERKARTKNSEALYRVKSKERTTP